MSARLLSLQERVQGLGRGRWAAIALGTAAAGYVGVVTYRCQQRMRRKIVELSPLTLISSGVALGVISMATGPALRRWGTPRPDRVLSTVLPMLRANPEVREMVGTNLAPGLFRAHTYSGGVTWTGVKWGGVKLFSFQPYSLQLLFQVNGEASSAMVSLSARNHTPRGRGLVFESLVVDLPNGERLVLKGDVTEALLESYRRKNLP